MSQLVPLNQRHWERTLENRILSLKPGVPVNTLSVQAPVAREGSETRREVTLLFRIDKRLLDQIDWKFYHTIFWPDAVKECKQ